jgi:hypothetical protein
MIHRSGVSPGRSTVVGVPLIVKVVMAGLLFMKLVLFHIYKSDVDTKKGRFKKKPTTEFVPSCLSP